KFGKIFFEEEKKLYGLHGFYATDPFHESSPISTDSSYLHGVAKAVLKLYREADKDFKYWIMQGWTPTKEIVEAIPKDSLIILDLADPQYTPSKPGEKKFWGYPYLAGNLHNFGGRINMHGDIEALSDNQYTMAADDGSPVVGSGIFMEGICQNPLYYDLAFEMPVHQDKVSIKKWLEDYSARRYGYVSDNTYDALIRLWHNPYRRGTNGTEKSSIIAARPALHPKKSGPNSNFGIPYSQDTLIIAEDFLLGCDPVTDGYLFDIVDIQRQIMSNLGQGLNKKIAEAFDSGDIAEFDRRTAEFFELLTDLDSLVGTRREYSFEDKIQRAHSWATTQQESDLYDFNQSMQVTQWGPVQISASDKNGGNTNISPAQFDGQDVPQSWYGRDVLFDYSWREWSGLIREYYLPRWQMFYKMLRGKLTDGSWK
ncbi:MAG TPA: alpha-N-acetylglucosaminidase C-terminal domain-containing protein, partial [Candidatus Egerieousia sp.]|nr:alpha-N-acetylglucosaminidase C-terminal domain-containing protein [Candidatus Egerieousia sp.]